jgi:ribulose-phosphate 3-epimerase
MPLVCPTVTPDNTPASFDIQLRRILPFARRVHLDLMDGEFASPKSVNLHEIYWPDDLRVDLHIMYQQPWRYLKTICSLQPFSVIVHAESEGDFMMFADTLHQYGIGVGVALLPQTPVEAIAPALSVVDHVLIFSGRLGHYGGVADMRLLVKARQLLALKPDLEIGWDGGINSSNVRQLAAGGVDVLNVGGFIQHAVNPQQAYATLESLL